MYATLTRTYDAGVRVLFSVAEWIGQLVRRMTQATVRSMRRGWARLAIAHAIATIHDKYPDAVLETEDIYIYSLRYAEIDLYDTQSGDLWMVRVLRHGLSVHTCADRVDAEQQDTESRWLSDLIHVVEAKR